MLAELGLRHERKIKRSTENMEDKTETTQQEKTARLGEDLGHKHDVGEWLTAIDHGDA